MIANYFPFEKKSVNNHHQWGIVKWLKLNIFNETAPAPKSVLFEKFDDLNGFPIKVIVYPRFPTLLTETETPAVFSRSYFMNIMKYSCGYSGIDGLMLGNVAQNLNFTVEPVILNDTKGNFYAGKITKFIRFDICFLVYSNLLRCIT